jgi:hypothetical protein
MDDVDMMTMRECADACRLKSLFAIRAAIRRRELPAIRISHRHVLVPKASFIKWVNSKKYRSVSTAAAQIDE